ncbi:hypothetical protein EDB85DRAFT_1893538 [Lactarius pseudohatsudake]|nr:hypothetical protein EDB85DRAFT_1893538 [Lactarius pseudohatsudake]
MRRRSGKRESLGEAPALYIVLASNGDLAEITRNHPHLHKHAYYQSGAEFPQDISDLLPSEDHWWETIAAKSQNLVPPPDAVTCSVLPRVKLILGTPPPGNVVVVVNKSQKKCKHTLPPGGKTQKRHAGPSQLDHQPAHEDEYKSEEGQEQNNNGNKEEDEDEIEEEDELEDKIKDEDKLEDEIEDEDEEEDNDNDNDEDEDSDKIKEHKWYKFEVHAYILHHLQLKEPENSATNASVPGWTAS